MSITPQAGMPVVYHARPGDVFDCSQPLAATISYVWSDSCVNLTVLDMHGVPWARRQVMLWQPGDVDQRPAIGGWCEFPTWLRYAIAPRGCARCPEAV